jgi:uncharacterized membrane protein
VAYSPYGRIYGVPIGYFGLFFYAVMLAFGSSRRGLRLVVLLYSIIGVCGSIGFVYLDLVFIRAFCIYCLISAIDTVVLLLSAIVYYRAEAGGRQLIAAEAV